MNGTVSRISLLITLGFSQTLGCGDSDDAPANTADEDASIDAGRVSTDAGRDAASAQLDAGMDAAMERPDAGSSQTADAAPDTSAPDLVLCEGDDGGPATPDWIVEKRFAEAGAEAEIGAGVLKLSDPTIETGAACPSFPCAAIKASQLGVTGDFGASISIVDFTTDADFGEACLYVLEQDGFTEAHGCFVGNSNLLAVSKTDAESNSIPVAGDPRQIRISRMDATVTITLITTEATRTAQGPIDDGPLTIGVYVDNSSGTQATVSFDDFTIACDSGALADDFER